MTPGQWAILCLIAQQEASHAAWDAWLHGAPMTWLQGPPL